MSLLYQMLSGADTAIQCLLVVVLVLRGSFRKYPVFALYVFGESAADVSEGIAYYHFGWQSQAYRKLYWTDHVTLSLLLFLVVIAFTYAAVQGTPLRLKAAKVLGVIVAVAVALPFAILHDHHTQRYGFFSSQWFNHALQIWNFGAAIVNLVLWAALVSNRRRDRQLVTLSIGLGIVTSTAAIVWGARQWLAQAHRVPLDTFMMMAHLVGILLWCWAFRPKTVGHPSLASPPRATDPPRNAPFPAALITKSSRLRV